MRYQNVGKHYYIHNQTEKYTEAYRKFGLPKSSAAGYLRVICPHKYTQTLTLTLTLTRIQQASELQQCFGESSKKMMLHIKQISQIIFQLK